MRRFGLRRIAVLLIAALVLAGCAPSLQGSLGRTNGDVTIAVSVGQPTYSVNLTVLNAATLDPRCLAVGPDLSCALGNMTAGVQTVVTVTGEVGTVSCTLSGFLDPGLNPARYRTALCK